MDLQKTVESLLQATTGFETKNASVNGRQLRLLGSIPQNRIEGWLATLSNLLQHGSGSTWTLDASKQYFLRGEKLMYGWRLIFQAEDLSTQAASIAEAIRGSRPHVEYTEQEIPLHGSPTRHSGPNGKGAAAIGGNGISGPRRF